MLAITLVALGGALGAITRFASATYIHLIFGLRFPYGTLVVNSAGSFLAGFIMIIIVEKFSVSHDSWRLFWMVGFLGAFTTFSSFAWETWSLFTSGDFLLAWLNILLNNIFSLGLVFCGVQCGRVVSASFLG